MKTQYILGIESTAHTFGIAILSLEKNIKDTKILCNIKDSYTTEKGGMVPMQVAEHHNKIANSLYKKALQEANIKEEQIKVIAFSNAPGLAPCLIEGMKFAKSKAKEINIPIIPVNHCIAHLEIGSILKPGPKDPVLLYASGANTQIIAYEAEKYRVFGETLDLGVGNFIDTFARHAGLGFPGGPKIQKLAEQSSKELIELPYSIKGMDLSFSGLQTKLKQLLDSKKHSLIELSYSMQETVFAMLVEAAERALSHTGKKELLLGGGVACNTRLQEMCKKMCQEREEKTKFFCPPNSLLVDNAAMIAYLGIKIFNSKKFNPKKIQDIDIAPRERTDDLEVYWK